MFSKSKINEPGGKPGDSGTSPLRLTKRRTPRSFDISTSSCGHAFLAANCHKRETGLLASPHHSEVM